MKGWKRWAGDQHLPPPAHPPKLPRSCCAQAASLDRPLLQDRPANRSQPAPGACERSGAGARGAGGGACVCEGAGRHRSLPEYEAPSWGRWGCGGAAGSQGGPRRTEPRGLGEARSPEAPLFPVALLSLAGDGDAMEAGGWASPCTAGGSGGKGGEGWLTESRTGPVAQRATFGGPRHPGMCPRPRWPTAQRPRPLLHRGPGPTKARERIPTAPTALPPNSSLRASGPLPAWGPTAVTQGRGTEGPSPDPTWKKPGAIGPAANASLGAMLPITGLGAAAALCRAREVTGRGPGLATSCPSVPSLHK